MKKRILLAFLAIILLSNLPFFNFFLQENFTYANADHSFTYSEEGGKGMSLQSCLITYGYFLCRHPEKDQGDNRLYRTFTIKPWYFWEWYQLVFHSERFTLPYKHP